jgi:hypothetical protein
MVQLDLMPVSGRVWRSPGSLTEPHADCNCSGTAHKSYGKKTSAALGVGIAKGQGIVSCHKAAQGCGSKRHHAKQQRAKPRQEPARTRLQLATSVKQVTGLGFGKGWRHSGRSAAVQSGLAGGVMAERFKMSSFSTEQFAVERPG